MVATKACLLGESGVGKSTISNLLQKKPVGGSRKPTIGVNIEKIETNRGGLCLWDLAGQKRFQFMWNEFSRGSGLTIVVTDSTAKNVMLTKDIIERHLNTQASRIIAIANKQDCENRLDPSTIESSLGVPTYGMVSIDDRNYSRLMEIIEKNM